MQIEMNQEETLELMRLLRSVPAMEMDSAPAFPIRSEVSLETLTLQIQSTFEFVSDTLMACNRAHEQGNLRDVLMILKLFKRLIIGYEIVYSEAQQSYVLVPSAKTVPAEEYPPIEVKSPPKKKG